MWFPVLFLLFVCRASLASYLPPFEKCWGEAVDALDDIFNLQIPDGDTLETVCPVVIDHITCLEDVTASGIGISKSQKRMIKALNYSHVLRNTRRILQEVCDADSQLHKDFKANIECMYEIQNNYCMETALDIGIGGLGAKEIFNRRQRHCMMATYETECTAAQIYEECGEKAFDAYLTITRESLDFQYGVCREEVMEDARAKFFSSSLEMSDAEKEQYKLALDLKKKRK